MTYRNIIVNSIGSRKTYIAGSNLWPRAKKKMNRLRILLKKRGYPLPPKTKLYFTNDDRGYCLHIAGKPYLLVIPLRALDHGADYFDYYAIHEASHAIAHYYSNISGHSKHYYTYFHTVCPSRYWHWECQYMWNFKRFLQNNGYKIINE